MGADNFDFRSALRTAFRHFINRGAFSLLDHSFNSRNDVSPFRNPDPIADGKFEKIDIILIVKSYIGNHRSADLHRYNASYRCHASRPSDLNVDLFNRRFSRRGFEFISDRPLRMMFRITKRLSFSCRCDFKHQTVDFIRQSGAFARLFFNLTAQPLFIRSQKHRIRIKRKTVLPQFFENSLLIRQRRLEKTFVNKKPQPNDSRFTALLAADNAGG